MPTIDFSHPYYKGKLTPEEEDEFIRLSQKLAKPTKKEEEEMVEFFVELIPVLQEIEIDLKRKGLIEDRICSKGCLEKIAAEKARKKRPKILSS